MSVVADVAINGIATNIHYSKVGEQSDYLFHFTITGPVMNKPQKGYIPLAGGSVISVAVTAESNDSNGNIEVWNGILSCRL